MNDTTIRRSFLHRIATLPIAAGLPSSRTSAAIATIKHVGSVSLKPALNAYSFLELPNANLKDATTGIDLIGVCDFAAKHDCAAVDLTGYFFLVIQRLLKTGTSPASKNTLMISVWISAAQA